MAYQSSFFSVPLAPFTRHTEQIYFSIVGKHVHMYMYLMACFLSEDSHPKQVADVRCCETWRAPFSCRASLMTDSTNVRFAQSGIVITTNVCVTMSCLTTFMSSVVTSRLLLNWYCTFTYNHSSIRPYLSPVLLSRRGRWKKKKEENSHG